MIKGLVNNLTEYAASLGARVVGSLGELAIERIKQRTRQEHTDRLGQPLSPYKEKYAAWKKVPQGQVDLTLRPGSGMLDALAIIDGRGAAFESKGRGSKLRGAGGRFVAAGEQSLTIGITDPKKAQVASILTRGNKNMAPRDFMGVESGWVSQQVDDIVRNAPSMAFGDEQITVTIAL